jgi:hypothetical protein
MPQDLYPGDFLSTRRVVAELLAGCVTGSASSHDLELRVKLGRIPMSSKIRLTNSWLSKRHLLRHAVLLASEANTVEWVLLVT